MLQLNLFDTDPETQALQVMNEDSLQTKSDTSLLTVEELECLPTYQVGQIVTAVQQMFHQHKSEGRDGFARAIAYEWIVRD